MLSYEDELALSDLIVEGRQVRDELEKSGQEPSDHQSQIIRRGDVAASNLVEAYLPAIRSFASSMLSKSYSPRVTFDDLVNEGTAQAMMTARSFNCRGAGNRKGKRFASYAGMAITKSMGRLMAKMSVPLTVNVDVIVTSYTWNTMKSELRDKLGREPSVEQIEEYSGINSEYVAGAPSQSSFTEIDDENSPEIADDQAYAKSLPDEYIYQEGLIRSALESTFGVTNEIASDLILLFGLDRMYVRDRDEMAIAKDWSSAKTTRRIKYIKSALAHPSFRVAISRHISDVEEAPENAI